MLSKPLSRSTYLIIATVVLLLAFWLRTVDLGNVSFWIDEAYTAQSVAIARSDAGFVESVRVRFNHMPLYFASILLYPGDHSDFSLRYPSVMWSMLTIAVMMRILTHLYHFRRYALLAGVLLATHSLVIIQSREARMYAMANFLIATSTYFFLFYLEQTEQKNRDWLFMIIASLGAYLTHIATFLLIPAQGLMLMWQVITRRLPAKHLVYWGATQALILIPPTIWILTVIEHNKADRLDWVPSVTPERIIFVVGQLIYGYLDLTVAGWEQSFILALFPILILIPALRTRRVIYWLGLSWVSFLALIVISEIQSVFDERYLAVAIFAYITVLVMSYKAIGDILMRRYQIVGMLAMVLIIGIQLSLATMATALRYQNGSFALVFSKHAIEYINENSNPNDILMSNFSLPVLEIYTEHKALIIDKDVESYLNAYATRESSPYKRVWLAITKSSEYNTIVQQLGFEPVYEYYNAIVYFIVGDPP